MLFVISFIDLRGDDNGRSRRKRGRRTWDDEDEDEEAVERSD